MIRRKTFHRFALGASNVCPVGKSPMCSVPACCRDAKFYGLTDYAEACYRVPPAPPGSAAPRTAPSRFEKSYAGINIIGLEIPPSLLLTPLPAPPHPVQLLLADVERAVWGGNHHRPVESSVRSDADPSRGSARRRKRLRAEAVRDQRRL